jgi:uncharacterized phage-associated protein
MRNSISCDIVADYFLLRVDPSAGDTISHLKLQKLCYYAQAWSLGLHRKPLFHEPIEAWTHGPVVRKLYSRFKRYGWQSIEPTDLVTDPLAQLSDETQQFLDSIWDKYGKFSGRQLELMTHSELPWKVAYGDTQKADRCDEVITHDAMLKYYSAKARRHADNTRAAGT